MDFLTAITRFGMFLRNPVSGCGAVSYGCRGLPRRADWSDGQQSRLREKSYRCRLCPTAASASYDFGLFAAQFEAAPLQHPNRTFSAAPRRLLSAARDARLRFP